ncbi:helix-turn-helix domain-containing protein [Saccharothrix syringae]|nr:helix-turn-helix transcriptional regulator [Saccharothrix syringae]
MDGQRQEQSVPPRSAITIPSHFLRTGQGDIRISGSGSPRLHPDTDRRFGYLSWRCPRRRTVSHQGELLRAARSAAGMTLAAMSTKSNFDKGYLSKVERGLRPASSDVVEAYERVLGVGGLDDEVDRRQFLSVVGIAAANARLAAEPTAGIACGDAVPLTTVQTTCGVDRAPSLA